MEDIKYVMFKFKTNVAREQKHRVMNLIKSWKDVAEVDDPDTTTLLGWLWVRTKKNTKQVLNKIKKLKDVENNAYIPAPRKMFKRN